MINNIEFIPSDSKLLTPEYKAAIFSLLMEFRLLEDEINNQNGKITIHVNSTIDRHIELTNVNEETKYKFKLIALGHTI